MEATASPSMSPYRVGHIGHLASRFFNYLSSKPLTPAERSAACRILEPGEQAVFFAQPAQDQRHGFTMAAQLEGREAKRTALLHDGGKRHARLGALGRVLATLIGLFKLPARGRIAMYQNHGPIAARELAEISSTQLVVAYTRDHHGNRPPGISPETWSDLQRADRVVVQTRRNRQHATTPRNRA